MLQRRPSRREFVQCASVFGAAWLAQVQAHLSAQDQASRQGDTVPLAPPDQQPPDLELPDRPGKKLGWAIVGLGTLALEELLPAFKHCASSRPVALVSGHSDKARTVAAAYGIPETAIYDYDNYDRLADNSEVDIVYIVLPNSMHAEFTIRAHQAGKHVLCEKPMAANVAECRAMIAAAEKANKQLMIAYRLHYEPFNRQVMDWCRNQTFGSVQTISSSNCQVVKAPNIRLSRKLAGGPVGDIGIYSINACRYITREEPAEVTAISHSPDDPRFREVPASVAFTLRFPSGVLAHCDCSFNAPESRRYRVHCTEGWIEMDPAFSYRGLRLLTHEGQTTSEHQRREVNQFASEMDHFSECVLHDRRSRTPGEEGLADMHVLAAIDRALESHRTAQVARG